MIKAVFFDIDGTLVSFQTHQVPQDTRDALHELHQNGIRIFVSTGRGRDELLEVEGIPFDGYITLNGQYCCTQDTLVYENTLDRRDLENLWRLQKDHPFPCGFTTDHGKFYNFRDAQVDEINETEEKELLAQLPNSISARWHPYFVDICPRGGTKQLGMEKFLEYYGIDRSETMSFGDGGNDLPMIRYAQVGVAMGNAVDIVKQHADYVTGTPDDHGIANALRHFGLITPE